MSRRASDRARYTLKRPLGRYKRRRTDLVLDRLTGEQVVRKVDSLFASLTEARCLLSIPPRVAPRLLDVEWRGAGRLDLFLEHVGGKTLREAAGELPLSDAPRLAQEISAALSHLHRAGWIHADLKPENVLLLEHDGSFSVRLLDFGFALSRFGRSEPRKVGGTPPYMAPELERGWITDLRADLYSLGITLREVFPGMDRDPRWTSILRRLTSKASRDRPSDTRALDEIIRQEFDAEACRTRLPRLGSGPMIGRDTILRCVVDAVTSRPTARILVQGRPGAGVSRFLKEAVLEIASSGGPPVRLADLSGATSAGDWDGRLNLLERHSTDQGAVLCGIGDPSPGLRWLDAAVRRRITGLLGKRWQRVDLPGLDSESLHDLVFASLGRADPQTKRLSQVLQERTEGDLRLAADGHDAVAASSADEAADGWMLVPERMSDALSAWNPPAPTPRICSVPASLMRSLALCARLGPAFSARNARSLLDRFGNQKQVPKLVVHGYLRTRDEGILTFVTKQLWREAIETEVERGDEVERWAVDYESSEAQDIDTVLHLAGLARRLQDREQESRILAQAVARAHGRWAWSDLLRLLPLPEGPAQHWVQEEIIAKLTDFAARLTPSLSPEQLLAIAAPSVMTLRPDIGLELLKRVSRGGNPEAAGASLLLLASREANNAASQEYQGYRDRLQEDGELRRFVPEGAIEFLDGHRAMTLFQPEKALRHAKLAAGKLSGSGHRFEAMNLQLLAILRAEKDPSGAVGALRSAIDAASEPELEGQLRFNLAHMYFQIGEPASAMTCVDDGLRRLDGTISSGRLQRLRIVRAWSLAHLDSVELARSEVTALLSAPTIRFSSLRLVPIRLLLAHCLLHAGDGSQALSEVVQAWLDSATGCPASARADCLRVWGDAILDLSDWSALRSHASIFSEAIVGDDPFVTTSRLRARALHAQAEGEFERAGDALSEGLTSARGLLDRVGTARYLHHMGLVRLCQARAGPDGDWGDEAVALFNEELDTLPKDGYGYYRAHALAGLSLAQSQRGNSRAARDAITRAVSLSKSIRAKRLLADCLSIRASLRAASL